MQSLNTCSINGSVPTSARPRSAAPTGGQAPLPARPSAGCPSSRRGRSWWGRARNARATRSARLLARRVAAAHPDQQVDRLAPGKVGPQGDVTRNIGKASMDLHRIGPRIEPEDPAAPPSTRSSPSRARIVVDFPAPLGPRKPCTSPARTSRSKPSRAPDRPEVLDQTGHRDDRSGACAHRSIVGRHGGSRLSQCSPTGLHVNAERAASSGGERTCDETGC